jgi:hypothetical protein
MQRTAGYTKWDLKCSEDVMKELHIESVLDYIQNYQKQWKSNLHQMNTAKIFKAILHYQPTGKRSLGCPMKKRWCENSSVRL